MPLLEEEYRKEEKINGVIYDMSPSPNYQHGIVDGNIYSIIKSGLKGTLCLAHPKASGQRGSFSLSSSHCLSHLTVHRSRLIFQVHGGISGSYTPDLSLKVPPEYQNKVKAAHSSLPLN